MSQAAFTYSSKSESESSWVHGEYSESPSRNVDANDEIEGDESSEQQEHSKSAFRTSARRSVEDHDRRRMISCRSKHPTHSFESLFTDVSRTYEHATT